ncbi:Retinoic acid induced 16-like protein-domain-containing protein [Cokeromyces recurvatus]|uniref:Retinoic acid induced 16-like protein-domain-containing protein n=1 Tax=Cokeromyces recurvatus TaxID=90255 RepID=UPI00221EFB2B|nr:Retinoic acid induced 16-like protein-domain-containing protein [Cokeromyces recurvatus]KAI7907666.1 Retinoic acid induced 16-like protein-domain-containing protein [Cokeromyces recurvatus]
MDYFTKFTKRIAPPKVQPTGAMQLSKFHKNWEYIHNIFVMDDHKANVHVQQTEIPAKLRQMVDLLVDEEARQEDNTTGLCMEYFLKNGILQYLVSIVEKADYPVGVRGEAIRMIANMIDLLDDRFLVHNAVHRPTIRLLRFCVLDDRQSELYSDDLVDLMYIICSKIHGFPALLNIFFHDKLWLNMPQKSSIVSENDNSNTNESEHSTTTENPQHEYEFLLFTYLLRFVHREGRSGDFARTGLLFLMELANDQLGDFILGSDFATIMAAGLGALYSQLPRKLIIKDEIEQIYSNPVSYLLGQDSLENNIKSNSNRFARFGFGAEYSNSHEFRYQLDSFLKLLEFCQDVIIRCPNPDICISLLKSIRSIFLENILYPSILECSDLDGSSVAVISYIDLILQTVQQEDLSKVIVGYLMVDEEIAVNEDLSNGINHMDMNKDNTISNNNHHLAHFTLKDLIFSRLKSNSQSTVIATLKLLKTLITNHCQYSLGLLSIYIEHDSRSVIISHHLREIELYFSLIAAIDKTHAKDVLGYGYEEYLRDVEIMFDNDDCYHHMRLVHENSFNMKNDYYIQTPKAKRRRSFKYGQRYEDNSYKLKEKETKVSLKQQTCGAKSLLRHRLRSTDPLLQILLNLLSHFFTQSVELNLALTGVISALALCPYRNLEGWITFSESDRTGHDDVRVLDPKEDQASTSNNNKTEADKVYQQDIYEQERNTISSPINNDNDVDDDDDENDDRSIDFGAEQGSDKKTSPTYFKSYPSFFTLLRTLTQQVDYYRSEIQEFDTLLDERRKALITGELSFSDKRVMSPSNSLTTAISARIMNNHHNAMNRKPSILRPSLSTPLLSPSSSTSVTSTLTGVSSSPISSNLSSISNTNMNVILSNPMSPLTVHVKRTTNTRLQPLFPSNFTNEREEAILDLDDEDEHMFTPKSVHPSKSNRVDKSTEITLSMLLNNVVILEETIKELVALIQVRRSLGIDKISYV